MCGTTSALIKKGLSDLIPANLEISPYDDADEYGFFEELDIDKRESLVLSSPTSPFNAGYNSKCSSPTSLHGNDALPFETDSSCGSPVVFEVEDDQAPITCRYFTSGESVFICIEGFRIVQESCNYSPHSRSSNEVAEYKVKMSINGVAVSVWRRSLNFSELVKSCFNFAQFQRPRLLRSNGNFLKRSSKTWQKIVNNRPPQGEPFSTKHIVSETTLLKVFMKHMLFEAPSLDLLVDFMR